jgi:hypothetical protein
MAYWSDALSFDDNMQIVTHLSLLTQAMMRMVCKEFFKISSLAKLHRVYKPDVLCASIGGAYDETTGTLGIFNVCTSQGLLVLDDTGSAEGNLKHIPRCLGCREMFYNVSTGSKHTVALTSSGNVYTWGLGRNGRLGHGTEQNQRCPRRIHSLREFDYNISDISAGAGHTVVCTKNGRTYTFGSGEMGELGHGIAEDELVPKLVSQIEKFHITAVTAATWCTLVRSLDGRLFSWGYGYAAQLSGYEFDVPVPQLVRCPLKQRIRVAGMALGEDHIALFCTSRRLYTYGEGAWGKLGHGGSDNERYPRLVEAITEDILVAGVACTNCYTMMYTTNGCLYSCGEEVDNIQYPPTFTLVEEFQHRKVVGARAKKSVDTHSCDAITMVWTADCEVYAFSGNGYYRIGEGYV